MFNRNVFFGYRQFNFFVVIKITVKLSNIKPIKKYTQIFNLNKDLWIQFDTLTVAGLCVRLLKSNDNNVNQTTELYGVAKMQ